MTPLIHIRNCNVLNSVITYGQKQKKASIAGCSLIFLRYKVDAEVFTYTVGQAFTYCVVLLSEDFVVLLDIARFIETSCTARQFCLERLKIRPLLVLPVLDFYILVYTFVSALASFFCSLVRYNAKVPAFSILESQ